MPLMYNKRTLTVKAEGTYGTYSTPINTDAGFRCDDPVLDIIGKVTPRLRSDGGLGTDVSPPEDYSTKLTFKTKLHGDGSTGDPNWAAKLFPAVGMPSSTTNTYATSNTTSSWAAVSAALNTDGLRRFGRGLMGNLKMSFTSGKPVICEWDFMGGYHEISSKNPDDATQLTSITYEEVVSPIFAQASAFTLDSSTSYKISTMSIDLGNQVFLRPDANSLGGYIGGWIGNRMPVITIDPEAVLNATKDWHDTYRAATQIGSIVAVVGSTTGNIATITATNLQIAEFPKLADRSGVAKNDLKLQVNGSITIAFT